MNNFLEKVYVVMGSNRRCENIWLVACYTEKEMAELHAEKAMDMSFSMNEDEEFRSDESFVYDWDTIHRKAQYQTEYYVEEVYLFRHLDEFLENVHKLRK